MSFEDTDNPVWQSVVASNDIPATAARVAVADPGTTALLAAPSEFAKEAIERSLREGITSTLSHHLGQPINLAVTVSDDQPDSTAATDRRYPHRRPTSEVDGYRAAGTGSGTGSAGSPSSNGRPFDGRSGEPRRSPGFREYPGFGAGAADAVPVDGRYDDENNPAVDEDDGDIDGSDTVATVTEIWPTYSVRRDQAPPNPALSRLNEKYSFETFVIGASNRFAHAAAVAVAEAPAVAYNPLFIWGDSGLGKTHLLHGIGHYAQRLFPGMRVRPAAVRPTARRDPYDGGRPGWRDLPGSASAAGSRGSWPGGGCWAGTYACSRLSTPTSNGWHCSQYCWSVSNPSGPPARGIPTVRGNCRGQHEPAGNHRMVSRVRTAALAGQTRRPGTDRRLAVGKIATRRRASLLLVRSCGKSSKVVSVQPQRLEHPPSPRSRPIRAAPVGAGRLPFSRGCAHLWTTTVDGVRERQGARGSE